MEGGGKEMVQIVLYCSGGILLSRRTVRNVVYKDNNKNNRAKLQPSFWFLMDGSMHSPLL